MSFSLGTSQMTGSMINRGQREARAQTWLDYQIEVGKRLDVLQGFWETHLKRWSKKRLSDVGWLNIYGKKWPWTTEINMMKRVFNRIGKVYNGPVRRRFSIEQEDGSFIDDPGYSEILSDDSVDLDRIGHEALMISLACGGCLVRPQLRDDDSSRWVFHVITPFEFIPDVDPVDPTRLQGVSYIVPVADSPAGQQLYHQYIFSIADQDSPYFEIRNDSGQTLAIWGTDPNSNTTHPEDVQQGDYPYINPNGKPVLPFALFRVNGSSMDLLNRAQGVAEYELSLKCGFIETIKTWTMQHSTKLTAIGGPGTKDIENRPMDVSTPITLAGGGGQEITLQILDMIDDGARFDDYIERAETRMIEEYTGSRADAVSRGGVESGKALQIRDKGLAGVIRGFQRDMAHGESQLADIMRMEWNLFGPDGRTEIDMDAEFRIDFPDWLEADPIEAYAEYKELIADNITNKAAYLMKVDRDIPSEEEAKEIILHNQRVNREISGLTSNAEAAARETAPPVDDQTIQESESIVDEIQEDIEDGSETRPETG